MAKQIVIVGGGAAGWLCAAYLARTLATSVPGGAKITLIESADIGILGVGEGTFPNIKNTLKRIGIDEAYFIRETGATFKQGIRFDGWEMSPGASGRNHYFHPFQSSQRPGELELLPYWLLGCAGDNVPLDEALTIQKAVADHHRGPKRIFDDSYQAPLNYAYHFDAMQFAKMLRKVATDLGVQHLVGTVESVVLDEQGAIESVQTREHGALKGDLYIDCSGFHATLIGKALKSPFKSCRDSLFCDRAVAVQVPYDQPDAPIASYTISTAQEAGWTWDIGLDSRRGIGHVYSSAHTDDDRAEAVLRGYVGSAANDKPVRTFKFNAGYHETPWTKNCVAVGLANGFFEPLEATGIVFVEIAAIMIANLFPWAGDMATAARQFNRVMVRRYERAADFLKMHYSLSKRRDSAFWRDNTDPATISDSLLEILDRWQFRPPEPMDFDMNYETFSESSWAFVLYGMGFKTDLTAKAAAFAHYDVARAQFQDIRRQEARALADLPSHRDLIRKIVQQGFTRPVRMGPQNIAVG